MADKKLLAIVTVLILIGSSGAAQQEASISDLQQIEKLIEVGDWRALYSYLVSNPQLTVGTSPLALELRAFSEDVESGRIDTFNVASTEQVSRNQTSVPAPDETIY
ncbi:MAG: hypothetical protein V2I76_00350 [Roseobacter sp.]|jgi:hypothetical protein|nr:hypothetical protein [Roseobacter sp.]